MIYVGIEFRKRYLKTGSSYTSKINLTNIWEPSWYNLYTFIYQESFWTDFMEALIMPNKTVQSAHFLITLPKVEKGM